MTFFTSMIAGVFGFGGGMLLMAILPAFISPSLIIPLHGITQLASNSSRTLFSLNDVKWALLRPFLIGSIIGSVIVVSVLSTIPVDYIPVAIGLYMLLNLWSPRFSAAISKYESYYLLGFVQTGLGLVVGATGPIVLAVLTKQLKSKDQIIATSSMCMTISHFAKIPVYFTLTSSLFSNVSLISYMVIGAVVGSFVGTKLRLAANNDKIIKIIKWMISLLAIRMVVAALV
ncbi:sulfite exporter TauE/SafE family protein [Vibrio brasiliensis]|uniref:sulfite exporter TauE/SafE family protein n=1 Tax=Vibrio brasiliensis TaxID=170652 RepID=UPI001EFDAFEB|nr:sulfite exporter TauE/SafE family protein [Vibrio brasiliensis]MCG9782922.1 sulfite exporter TauE/SafE family protein [Vibrio brasiliensis]